MMYAIHLSEMYLIDTHAHYSQQNALTHVFDRFSPIPVPAPIPKSTPTQPLIDSARNWVWFLAMRKFQENLDITAIDLPSARQATRVGEGGSQGGSSQKGFCLDSPHTHLIWFDWAAVKRFKKKPELLIFQRLRPWMRIPLPSSLRSPCCTPAYLV